MEKDSVISYIESSFIKDILDNEDVTDITYNGRDIYFVTNKNGNSKSDIEISNNEVKDFLRQIANKSEKQFNYINPILDLNIGRFRLNAVYSSVGRMNEGESVTFALRIASKTRRINHDHKFIDVEVEELLDALIKARFSIVISGVPGSGKTEFQKYLISRIAENDRILIIDNTIELSTLHYEGCQDITLWQADEKNMEANVTSLIKNGLRINPDWMIVSEARGSEMSDILNSAMTGVPIITTIHSLDAYHALERIAKAVMMNEKKIDYQDIVSNIKEHLKIYIHLKKTTLKDKSIYRYISSIVMLDEFGDKKEIYSNDLKEKRIAKIDNYYLKTIINYSSKEKLGRFIGS